MSAYIIAQVDVTNPDEFEQYRAQVPATLALYDGEYIVRGGDIEALEGELAYPRVVVIKFPSMERAKAWHNSVEYEGPKALRQASSDGRLMVVDGYDG